MAYTPAKLSDLKQGLADRHDSGVLPTSSVTLSFWTRLLNRGILYCADRLGLNKETTLTTSSGSISLPDDFISINTVHDANGNEQTLVNETEKELQKYDVFWITGNQTDGFVLHAPEDEAFTVNYYFRPTPLVNDTDECIIPDPEAVVAYAYGMLRKSETDPIEDADASLQECENRLKTIADAISDNEGATEFTWN